MPIFSKNDNLEGPAPLSAPGGTLKKEQLMAILREVSEGSRSLEEAASALTASELHEANRVYATVDLDRQQRTGFPEVIFGEGKTAQQIAGILRRLNDAGQNAYALHNQLFPEGYRLPAHIRRLSTAAHREVRAQCFKRPLR